MSETFDPMVHIRLSACSRYEQQLGVPEPFRLPMPFRSRQSRPFTHSRQNPEH